MFTNLAIYRLPINSPISADELNNQMAKHRFSPCPAQDQSASGWIPFGNDNDFVLSVRGHLLLTLQCEKKLLPPAVIKRELNRRIAAFTDKNGLTPSQREKREMAENVTLDLLPKAFSQFKHSQVWINSARGYLVIDAASPNKAEETLEMLSSTIENLPLRTNQTSRSPSAAMAEWLRAGEAPQGFSIDGDCELAGNDDEKSVVKYTSFNLDRDDVRTNLDEGRQPTKLALTYNDRVSFTLTANGILKKISLLDLALEGLSADYESDEAERDALFFLLAEELTPLISALNDALGGDVSFAEDADAA